MVERRDVLDCTSVVGAHLDADGALSHGGEHVVPVEDLCYTVLHVHPLEASEREEGAVDHVIVELAQARLHIAAEVDALDVGVLGEDLRLAAERRRADHGARGHLLEGRVLGRDPRVSRVLALTQILRSQWNKMLYVYNLLNRDF